jgi:hypothetical protein
MQQHYCGDETPTATQLASSNSWSSSEPPTPVPIEQQDFSTCSEAQLLVAAQNLQMSSTHQNPTTTNNSQEMYRAQEEREMKKVKQEKQEANKRLLAAMTDSANDSDETEVEVERPRKQRRVEYYELD